MQFPTGRLVMAPLLAFTSFMSKGRAGYASGNAAEIAQVVRHPGGSHAQLA
jgi:hypothetical protein